MKDFWCTYGARLAQLCLFVIICCDATAAPSNKITICHRPPGNPDNAKTITIGQAALPAHLAHGDSVGACGENRQIVIDMNRSYGLTGTEFQLTARALSSTSSNIDYAWTVSDGRSFTGESVALSFTEPGFYSVELTGGEAAATTGIVVYADGQRVPAALPVPEVLGDATGEGELTLEDALAAAQYVGRVKPLERDRRRALDIDFSGAVDNLDVALIAEAVIQGEPLPDRLLDDSGQPGKVISVVSPGLLDPASLITVQVGDSGPQQPPRPILGFVSILVPFDAVVGPTTVKVFADGQLAGTYPFEVVEAAALAEDPVVAVQGLLTGIKSLLQTNETLVLDQLAQYPLPQPTVDVLSALPTAGRLQAEAIFAELETLLASAEGAAIAEAFLTVANANGLVDIQRDLETFLAEQAKANATSSLMQQRSLSPSEVCDQLLPAMCALQTSASLMDSVSGVVGTSCDVLLAVGLGLVFLPADGPFGDAAALSSWAAVCAPLEFTIDAAGVLTDLVSDIDADLRLSASPAALQAGEAAIIKATLDVFGLDDVCQIAGSEGASRLVDKLAEQLVGRMIKRKITVRAMERIFSELGEEFLTKFLKLLETAAKEAITATAIDETLLSFAQPYCEDIFGAELIIDGPRVITGPEPNEGTFSFLADGTGEYQCPDDAANASPVSAKFTATLDICGTEQSREVTVACSSKDVTIAMGDNGAANDDIYEVRVDGVTVLTTSSPVRSASVTIQSSAGATLLVQMLGRAAPDGIGTYFINFSGASLVSGDATSGTDLVPGAVKTFTLQVNP